MMILLQANSQADVFNKAVVVKWKETAHLPVGRSGHTAVLLHGSVYVGGGVKGSCRDDKQNCYWLDIYNVYANQWSASPITTPYCQYALTVLDDKLIIAGGMMKSGEVTNKVVVLDDGKWMDYSAMPTAKVSAAAVGYQSMLIVVGGETIVKGKWKVVATTELLDTTNRCWYICDDLPVPHVQPKTVLSGSTLFLLGGRVQGGYPSSQVFTASLDNLSSHQLKWQSLPDTPWCLSTPVVVYNKFLLTVAGRQPSDKTSQTSEVCAFNPSTSSWRQMANIPEPRNYSEVVGVSDNKIFVLGGVTTKLKFSCNTWVGTFE